MACVAWFISAADLARVVRVTAIAPVRPTEDPARVQEAVLRLFPDAAISQQGDTLVASTTDLLPLRRRVWELRIIDTFRGQFLHGMDAVGGGTTFRLSKQAALAGHVSFSPRPHPLGDITVRIESEPGDALTLEQMAWWMAPETKDGEIVGPR